MQYRLGALVGILMMCIGLLSFVFTKTRLKDNTHRNMIYVACVIIFLAGAAMYVSTLHLNAQSPSAEP